MRVTIIPEDKFIRKDDIMINLPEWNFDDSNIHAIQWYDTEGEIEYKGTPNPTNTSFQDTSILEPYINSLEAYLDAQSAIVPPPPPPPGPNYLSFWDTLLFSSVYASIRTQSFTSLPMNTLATEFIALIGDAKAGRPNTVAIQSSMSAIFSTGTFTEENVEEFNNILTVGHLDDIYSLSISTP
jgi:hypothetical protein